MTNKLWLLLPLLIIPAAFGILGSDALCFLIWWLGFLFIGLLVWPIAARLFPGGDAGYLLAKPLGLGLSSLLLWTLSYLKILPFHRWAILFCLFALGAAAWSVKDGWRKITADPDRDGRWRRVAFGELLFAAALLFWTFARGLKPEIDGLEKFMDVGFMNTLWRTDYLPALDMWLAGEKINYYYFGQYVYTFLAKLVRIRPEISYNLGMATTFALTFTLAYAAVSQMIGLLRRNLPSVPAFIPAAGGLLAAFLTSLAGNGHSFLYDPNSPLHGWTKKLNDSGLIGGYVGNPFWFADSTRFIGYNPDTTDKTIHEFPYYSFLVADLHAHVINLAFVLLLIALLVRLLSHDHLLRSARKCRQSQIDLVNSADQVWHRMELRQVVGRLRTTASNGPLLVIIMLLSISMMGNFWDFAVYFAVTALVLLILNLKGYGGIRATGIVFFALQCVLILVPFLTMENPLIALIFYAVAMAANHYMTLIAGDALTLTGAQMSWIFFLAHLLTLPFNISFDPISKRIAQTVAQTPFWQLLVLWGPHVLSAILLFALVLMVKKISKQKIPPADWLAVALGFAGIALIILPELVYVVDIYSGEFKRANTMFKFTYQAFVLLSLAWSYALARAAALSISLRKTGAKHKWPVNVVLFLLLIGLLSPAWYPIPATRQWLLSFKLSRYAGLDGLKQMATKNSAEIAGDQPDELAADYAAIQWFNEHVTGQPVVLEAAGKSYTDFGRISAFTGLPTVMGWETHQWLWRTSKSTPEAYSQVVWPRQQDVRQIYTTSDQGERQSLLEKYHVEYIVLGDLERSEYSQEDEDGVHTCLVQEELLVQSGTIVFQKDRLVVIKVNRPTQAYG